MSKERLDRLLVHLNLGSRTEIKGLIKGGRIRVDGVVATDPGMHVDPDLQQIAFDGANVAYQRHFHLLLHKPGGVITATEDPRKPTVMDVLPPSLRRRGLFPVGRLDKETEGLLLFTTDGELCHRLLSPKWHVDKQYLVQVDFPIMAADIEAFARGLTLEDGYRCMPARLEILGPKSALVTLQEGKYHQVKRMFGAQGKHVLYLKRLTMGPLGLGDLPLGEARPLTEAEVCQLYESIGLVPP